MPRSKLGKFPLLSVRPSHGLRRARFLLGPLHPSNFTHFWQWDLVESHQFSPVFNFLVVGCWAPHRAEWPSPCLALFLLFANPTS